MLELLQIFMRLITVLCLNINKILTGKPDAANGRKYFEIMVPLKYLSNSWRTLEMLLINREINLILT